MKQLKLAAIALLASLAFTACSDDDETPAPIIDPVYTNAYVINQGNYYGGVDGSIGVVGIDSLSYIDNVFYSVNGQSLGDSPQGAVKYGSKIYVPMYGSNLLWVLDAATLRIVAQVTTSAPEGVAAAAGSVFVTNNDGYVTRIDTVSYTVQSHVEVGPNPASITAYGDYVYASISDGYNYTNSYADGFRVAVLSATTGEKVKDIAVGMNPGPIVADDYGNVFVVNRGDYYTVMPSVTRIDATTGDTAIVASGQLIATDGTTLYVLNSTSDYTTGAVSTTSSAIDTRTGSVVSASLLGDDPQVGLPVSIDVDRVSGRLFICSDNSALGYAETGTLHIYTTAGTRVGSVATGIHPCGVVFF